MGRKSLSLVWAAGAAACLTFAPAEGQFYVGAGPSIPLGDFADEAVSGFHVQGSADLTPSFLPFGLRADVFYQTHGNVEREPGINVSLGGEWFRQLGLMLNGVYRVSLGAVEPYALVGAGWFREWHDDRSYSGTHHTTFNINAGVGFDVPITSRLGVFVEARQLNLAGGRELRLTPPAVQPDVAFRSVPITIGLRF